MSLQVEKYFEPFECMVEQFALDKDVKELLTTTKAGERMPDNAIYSTVLEKMVEVADVMEQSKTQMAQMREAMDKIQETAQMADVQMKNIDQIRDVIDDMSQVVQDNSAMAEETSATSEKLAAQSVTLNELVQKFELN